MIERFNSSLRHVLGCLIGVGLVASPLFASDDAPVLKKLKKISTLSSTVPSNGVSQIRLGICERVTFW